MWYQQHLRDTGASPEHPALSGRWHEAGVNVAEGTVCFMVASGEQILYEVGSPVSHNLVEGFVAGSPRAVVGGVEEGEGVEVSAADTQANTILLDLSEADWAAYVAELPSLGGTADCGVFREIAAGRKRVDVRSYGTLFKHADSSQSRVRDAAENLDFRYEESVNGRLQVLVMRLASRNGTPHISIHDSHGHAAASFTSAAVPEALLEGFSSLELKESAQYYKQFFEERFHVNRRGRPASKRSLALQVTVVRRRPEQPCGQGSLKPFAELAATVAIVSTD